MPARIIVDAGLRNRLDIESERPLENGKPFVVASFMFHYGKIGVGATLHISGVDPRTETEFREEVNENMVILAKFELLTRK